MLPDFLQSTFRTYKEDTNAVASWLAVKAKQCGYSADLLTKSDAQSAKPKRLKGKARIEAKRKEVREGKTSSVPNTPTGPLHVIGIKDFTSLAQYIAAFTKPVVQVPGPLVKSLNRAIDLRKLHNDWSRGDESAGKVAQKAQSDEKHSYFLGILEQTRDILRPRMPSDTLNDSLSKPLGGLSIAEKVPGSKSHDGKANPFDNLELEEPSQEFLDAPGAVRAAGGDPKVEPRYEVENLQSPEEKYLAAHCLFQDIRHIRSFLKTLWSMYKDHVIDLVAASITTDTAINLVRELEQEYIQRFPGTPGYEEIVHLFYGVQCVHQGHQPDHKQRPDDHINFHVYDLAEECMLTTYIVFSSLQDAIDPNHALVYKPGHFGHRDKRTTWSQKSARAKFQDDKLILLEGFPDLSLFARTTKGDTIAEDNLIRGIRGMGPDRDIPLWLVFAAQCFLDTQHVLERDLGRGHRILVRTASAIKNSIEQNLEFHASLRVENWPKSNDFAMKDMIRTIDGWILQDLVAERFRKASQYLPLSRFDAGCTSLTYIQIKKQTAAPDGDPYSMLQQYPLLCGLFVFALKARFQEMSIAFANAWGSILYTTHLYNAVRQEKFLGTVWKDMEMVISLQSPETLFVGNAPDNLEEYLKRYLLSMGYSATNFASNRRRGTGATASTRGPRGMKELGQVGKLFAERYCNNAASVAFTRESIRPIIEAKMDDDEDDDEHTIHKESSKENQKPSPTPKTKQAKSGSLIRGGPNLRDESFPTLDFLDTLANALHAEQLEVSIDYLLFHRQCWHLLRHVNAHCKPKLLEMFGAGYLDKENQLPFTVGYIFMAATQTSRVANVLLPRRTEEVTSRLRGLAADAFEELIGRGD
ncbi:MAG: hypothetical protein Q9218_007938, partial [Villophora microphyllina]